MLRSGLTTISTITNALEPAAHPNQVDTGTYHKAQEMLDDMSPELLFQLACQEPGKMRCQFVENGTYLDIGNQILAGQATSPSTFTTQTSWYHGIFLNAVAGPVFAGTSGVSTLQTNDPTVNITINTILTGISMANLFGQTQNYSDKLIPWAAALNIEMLCPEATLSGVVHIGSISVVQFTGGMSFSDLIKRASCRLDIKQGGGRIVNLRAAVSNRAAVHRPVNQGDLEGIVDEFISYAIFVDPSRSITTGALSPYSLSLAYNGQAVWWPDGQTPAMDGVIAPNKLESESRNTQNSEIDRCNAVLISHLNRLPTKPDVWNSVVAACMKRQDLTAALKLWMMTSGNGAEISATNLTSTALEAKPGVYWNTPLIEDDIAFASWVDRKFATVLHHDVWSAVACELYDSMMDALEDFLERLKAEIAWKEQIKTEMLDKKQVCVWKRGKKIVTWLDQDGMPYDPDQAYERLIGGYETDLTEEEAVNVVDSRSYGETVNLRSRSESIEPRQPKLNNSKMLKKK